MNMLQERINELVEKHGSLRAVASRLEADPGYLSRLRSGQMSDPGEDLLKRLGLKKVVTYERTRARK